MYKQPTLEALELLVLDTSEPSMKEIITSWAEEQLKLQQLLMACKILSGKPISKE